MSELLFRDDPRLERCAATVTSVDERGIRLDRTVFYPRGGGQPGDTGAIEAEGARIAIVDTVKDGAAGAPIHVPAHDGPTLAPGVAVTASIDWRRRHRLMRMHSCLHLLSALVPGRVTGGQVGAERSRIDFDLTGEVPDKTALSAALNALVAEEHPVTERWITDAELEADPALVKTMSAAPPRGSGRVRLIEVAGVDLQACGGTHVAHTGEIGRVRVSKIENKGRRNRRFTIVFDE